MLCRLHVVHYALIDEVEIEFGEGLNIITGETGAGKSILMGALSLVLGARANADVVRAGEERCSVEAIFQFAPDHPSLAFLAEMGIEAEDGELILRRDVLVEGRSRCFANGMSIPAKSLQSLGRLLVDLHGQHDHQSLLDVDRHIEFLDGFGNLGSLAAEVEEAFAGMSSLEAELQRIDTEAARRAERRELLQYQIQEIENVAPSAGEDETLEAERALLENAGRLAEIAGQLEQLLYEAEDSITDRLGVAESLLRDATEADPALQEKAESLESLGYEVEELSRFFGQYAERVEHNPERLAEVAERLETLKRLKAKYHGSLDDVLKYAEEARIELEAAEEADASRARLVTELEAARVTYAEHCVSLSRKRLGAAGILARAIESELSELGMPDVSFDVSFERRESEDGVVEIEGARYVGTPRGVETAEFLLSANKGEPMRPLVRIASGGEVSRIMLALKTVLAQLDTVQVLIFDEIDIGISGRIAEVVGRQLRALSERCQTVSITHLPQIAKMADAHFSVLKTTSGERTETYVKRLAPNERVDELAKLLGGEEISELTMKHARELLQQ